MPGVQQPLELLHQLGALVAAALGVEEHYNGLYVGRGDRLDGKSSRLILVDLSGGKNSSAEMHQRLSKN